MKTGSSGSVGFTGEIGSFEPVVSVGEDGSFVFVGLAGETGFLVCTIHADPSNKHAVMRRNLPGLFILLPRFEL
jgi:hypothetical protein